MTSLSNLLSLSLSAAYGILISFGALLFSEVIGKKLGIFDQQHQKAYASVQERWFYTILLFIGLCVAVYLPQAVGLGNSTVYSISGFLSFLPLYLLFVRRWRRKGWVNPWTLGKKKLKKDLPQYLLAFAIVLMLFALGFLRRHWSLLNHY